MITSCFASGTKQRWNNYVNYGDGSYGDGSYGDGMYGRERLLRFLLDADTRQRLSNCYRFTKNDCDLITWATMYYPTVASNITAAENAATDFPQSREQANAYIASALAWLKDRHEQWETAGDVLFAFERASQNQKIGTGSTKTHETDSTHTQTPSEPQNAPALRGMLLRRKVRKITDGEPMLIVGAA